MGMHDVFINITGGLKVEDPALDLDWYVLSSPLSMT